MVFPHCMWYNTTILWNLISIYVLFILSGLKPDPEVLFGYKFCLPVNDSSFDSNDTFHVNDVSTRIARFKAQEVPCKWDDDPQPSYFQDLSGSATEWDSWNILNLPCEHVANAKP